jgi:hypothetical protein
MPNACHVFAAAQDYMYISGGGVPNPLPAPLEVQAFHFETKTWSRLTCHADSTIRVGLSVPMGMQGRVLPNVDLTVLVSLILPMANPQLLRSTSMALFRLQCILLRSATLAHGQLVREHDLHIRRHGRINHVRLLLGAGPRVRDLAPDLAQVCFSLHGGLSLY